MENLPQSSTRSHCFPAVQWHPTIGRWPVAPKFCQGIVCPLRLVRVSADLSEVTIVSNMLLLPSPTRMCLFGAATPTLVSVVIEDVRPVHHRIPTILATPVRDLGIARFRKQLSGFSPTISDPARAVHEAAARIIDRCRTE